MIIGILSDTHNHTHNTRAALDALRERGITRLVHCGDVTGAQVVELFAGWDVSFVLGNMDRDCDELFDAARRLHLALPRPSCEITLNGTRIAAIHGHDHALLYRLIISGQFSFVFHGHTHRRRDEVLNPYGVRVINPGALGGRQSETRSVCVLDTSSGSLEFVEFPELH